MKVFLLKDVLNVGMEGEIVTVSDGYAANFLFPRKLAQEVTARSAKGFENQLRVIEQRKTVVASKTSMLAERIKGLKPVLKMKMHDGDKLYGAVNAQDLVDFLAAEGVSVAKNQIIFDKAIKTKGTHPVIVKLSNSLQPVMMVKIVSE